MSHSRDHHSQRQASSSSSSRKPSSSSRHRSRQHSNEEESHPEWMESIIMEDELYVEDSDDHPGNSSSRQTPRVEEGNEEEEGESDRRPRLHRSHSSSRRQHGSSRRVGPPTRSRSDNLALMGAHSGSLQRARSFRRPAATPPSRTKSMPASAERDMRREAMRASYRVSERDVMRQDAHNLERSRHGRSTLDSPSVSSYSSGNGRASSRRKRPTHSVEGGPLSSLLVSNEDRGRSIGRSASTSSGNFGSASAHSRTLRSRSQSIESADLSTDSTADTPTVISQDEEHEWLANRASRQDEILSLANQEKMNREMAQKKEEPEVTDDSRDSVFNNDDEGLMMMWKKKTALSQVARAFVKTAGVTRSAAKGSVNVVMDPKRAAKHIGSFTKDVAKGTVKVVKDPTKAAKQVGKTTVKVGMGSVNIAGGVTKGVAKGTLGVTTTVVKGGFKGTTKVVGGTAHGVKKVAKGTAKFITHRDKKHGNNGELSYDARNLAERNTSHVTLYDRIAGLADDDTSNKNEEGKASDEAVAAAAAAIASQASSKKGERGMKNHRGMSVRTSLTMPMMEIANNDAGSWDI